jgi:hypothetical protein
MAKLYNVTHHSIINHGGWHKQIIGTCFKEFLRCISADNNSRLLPVVEEISIYTLQSWREA